MLDKRKDNEYHTNDHPAQTDTTTGFSSTSSDLSYDAGSVNTDTNDNLPF
jgi:hypothetical protein